MAKEIHGEYTKSGLMLVRPKAYKKRDGLASFSFENFFINYARYHADDT